MGGRFSEHWGVGYKKTLKIEHSEGVLVSGRGSSLDLRFSSLMSTPAQKEFGKIMAVDRKHIGIQMNREVLNKTFMMISN